MFILISIWDVVSCCPGSTRLFAWKRDKVLEHLSTNEFVIRAGFQRGKAPIPFIECLIDGTQARNPKQTIQSSEVTRFLNKLNELITTGKPDEAGRLAESTSVQETGKNFIHYCTFLKYAYEQQAPVNVEITDIQNNVHMIKITAKRSEQPENKAADVLLFRNGRLVELNGYPIKVKQQFNKENAT